MVPMQGNQHVPICSSLPNQGKPERAHLHRWMAEEEDYVYAKYDDGRGQREDHDQHLREEGVAGFWQRQIVQYYDRAQIFLDGAREAREAGKEEDARHLELRAQQAMVKAMMTAKGLVESCIRVYGDLPMPGLPSGDVRPWV